MPGDEVEAITESAKAVQEAAKLGGKALDIGRDAGGWINRIFGKGIEDIVALHWSDRVRARRVEAAIYDWERLTELFRKVQARLNAKGVSSLRLVPPKIALALLENATVEYDDDLHTLWANLLATSLDTAAEEIQKKYISILSDLTSDDAKLLRVLYLESQDIPKDILTGSIELHPRKLVEKNGGPFDEISVITLNRLGLISPTTADYAIYRPDFASGDLRYPDRKFPFTEEILSTIAGDLEIVEITSLGMAFCKAVILE